MWVQDIDERSQVVWDHKPTEDEWFKGVFRALKDIAFWDRIAQQTKAFRSCGCKQCHDALRAMDKEIDAHLGH